VLHTKQSSGSFVFTRCFGFRVLFLHPQCRHPTNILAEDICSSSLQEGPLGWEVTAQCGEVSLVLWYSEEEEDSRSDPDQASTYLALLSCQNCSMTTASDNVQTTHVIVINAILALFILSQCPVSAV